MIAGVLLTGCSDSISAKEVSRNIENIRVFEDETKVPNPNYYEKESQIEKICDAVKKMDFTIIQPEMNISQEKDALYRDAYFEVLKSEIPTVSNEGKTEYFRDLYKAGVEFHDLDEWYSYYYNDLDGDGLPELAVKCTGYTYILKYDPDQNNFSVLFRGPTMYYTILGVRQIGYHDGLHAGVIRDRLLILNQDNEWEIVLDLEEGTEKASFYQIGTDESNKIDVGRENWNDITPPFFEAMHNPLQFETLSEIFGDSL